MTHAERDAAGPTASSAEPWIARIHASEAQRRLRAALRHLPAGPAPEPGSEELALFVGTLELAAAAIERALMCAY